MEYNSGNGLLKLAAKTIANHMQMLYSKTKKFALTFILISDSSSKIPTKPRLCHPEQHAILYEIDTHIEYLKLKF